MYPVALLSMINLCMNNLRKDFFFKKEYAELYLQPDYELFDFVYEEKGDAFFVTRSIKRPVNVIAGEKLETGKYDLETPYGYGGMITNSENQHFLQRAHEAYVEKCQRENIIAEFVRFHPCNQYPQKETRKWLDFCVLDREVAIADLEKERRWHHYSKKTRYILRRCGQVLNIEYDAKNIDLFCSLYYQTMDNNNADKFYYFDRGYFKHLLQLQGVELINVWFKNTVVSSGIFIYSGHRAYYHLSASSTEHRYLNGNYYLLEMAFVRAAQKRCRTMLLGGGRSNNPQDSLLRFKKKFASFCKPFYIGGKVFDKRSYVELNALWLSKLKDRKKLFLMYRG